MNSPIRSRSAK